MKTKTIVSVGAMLASLASISHAVSLDLTSLNASGTVNGGFFQQTPFGPTGTGVIQPFVRLQENGAESGYNTDLAPMPTVKTGSWTHDILLADVPVVTLSSIAYYQFLLDINENQGSTNELLSLHQLQVFIKDGTLSSADQYSDLTDPGGATKVWDLDIGSDGNSVIELDYSLNPGSGYGDMFAYIPVSAVGTDTTKNLYLYSAFGSPNSTSDGFEEWAVFKTDGGGGPGGNVPDGGTTLATLGVALLGLGTMRKLIGAKA